MGPTLAFFCLCENKRLHLSVCCQQLCDVRKFPYKNIHQTQLRGSQLGCHIVLPGVFTMPGSASDRNMYTKAFCPSSCREFRGQYSSRAGVIIPFEEPHISTRFSLLKCFLFFFFGSIVWSLWGLLQDFGSVSAELSPALLIPGELYCTSQALYQEL